ncbi:MlaD family protein [Pseudooceanicola algae]|uniref:Mce/MlaD domain-containing protein n=1 Tax=Pseudooceanicola algae TaxID=1537215 RepID=A0A418SAU0_9RHOB|nr:MlaD family protein [Pseudooceanicola algae]QPM91239.1 hypothetical protein PSAL_024900 [Pseudooceanicola algae]
MSDPTGPDTPGPDDQRPGADHPELMVKESRRATAERISIIWIVPLLALAIAIGVAWQNFSSRGQTIDITFANAEGISVSETELRYRDVTVGAVEKLAFTDGLEKVVVTVRVEPEVEDYVDSSASFWVVRPEVTAQGVTGLGTVLSGVYIQGSWDNDPGGLQREFTGASQAPLNAIGRPGLKIRLRAAAESGLTGNTPIEFRGIQVGDLGEAQISDDGTTVEANAIIYEPHDKMISSATRFWDSSGISFSIGASGAEVNFTSLSSLLRGGITFSSVVSGGQPVEQGSTFTVYSDESTARATAFREEEGDTLSFSAIFDDNVPGLAPGSAVTYGGLRIGSVKAVNGTVEPARFGDDKVRLLATFEVDSGLLGLPAGGIGSDTGSDATSDAGVSTSGTGTSGTGTSGAGTAGTSDSTTPQPANSGQQAIAFFQEKVKTGGIRARLATASILTGGLKIEMVRMPDAPAAEIDMTGSPNPLFPTTASAITDVSATAQGVFERINDLPVEQVMQSAINIMNNVSRLVGGDDMQAVPGEVRGLLGDARGFVASPQLQALPGRLDGVTEQIETLVQALNTRDLAGRLTEAMAGVTEVARSADTAIAGLPQLLDSLNTIAAKAETVPLADLAQTLDQLMTSADTLLAEPGTQQLPQSLSEALDELRGVLTDLRNGGAVSNLNQTLASARSAADSISDAAQDLPALLNRTETVLTQAGTTLQGYDANSGLGRQAGQTMREIDRAAAAIAALARELERNPNALFFGR